MLAELERAWVDTKLAPLYVWRIPPQPTTEELISSLQIIHEWVSALDRPYGWINDPRALSLQVIAMQRKILADHLRIVEPYSVRWCAGMSTIVTHGLIRGAAVAVGWLVPYAFPTAFHEEYGEAEHWVRERMLARGLTAPRSETR